MISNGALLRRAALTSRAASLASIGLCIGLWVRAKTVDQTERGNAERRALFVGLWPPMLWLMGDTVDRTADRYDGRGHRTRPGGWFRRGAGSPAA
ncbi:hypothetical protein FB558_0974 [Pseudonocardia kunmingensis]|uniref:Uncharacterized protein n=1 Tax=Pseudonocardia kunmingensis TaxID=630975 RepID=A0A543DY25_9PSEU|nr:hypothetical protein [Pseudonocardia kunmingensis]TQM14214.1 hypothetical protein FB558_0974 [Pseudonocardia kunmingensis]